MSSQETNCGEIFIVDDEPSIRESLTEIFKRAGFSVTTFASGAMLLPQIQKRAPVCIILDVHIPGKSGLDLLKELGSHDHAPVFVMSGAGEIPMVVEAIKNGAHDFIVKPFRAADLVRRVHEAIAANQRRATPESLPPVFGSLREPLTRREREVLEQILSGASNKVAGHQLGISVRTVEVHRARIMEKYGARNAAELTRMVLGSDRA